MLLLSISLTSGLTCKSWHLPPSRHRFENTHVNRPPLASAPCRSFLLVFVFVLTCHHGMPSHAAEPASGTLTSGLVFLNDEVRVNGTTDAPCLVLIPGLLANERSMACICDVVKKEDFTTAVFHYTSQSGIAAAAEQLSRELVQLKTRQPEREVVLITHSMGGLVARRCIEDVTLAPGNVSQLIMIAPPNQGSAIAALSASVLAEDFAFKEALDSATLELVDDALGSFFGRAKDELRPGSGLLTELNAGRRATGIRYCIIAGNSGPIPGEWVNATLMLGRLLVTDNPETETALRSASKLLTLEEWTKGRGDGVVSVASARLKGVDDFITMPFTHNSFGETPSDATDEVLREVMKRVVPEK